MALTALAEKVLVKAKELDQRGVVDPDSKLGFRNMTTQDYSSRATLVEAIRELERLSLGPLETLHDIALKSIDGVSLYASSHYKIPLHIPNDGIRIRDLAIKLNLDEEKITRLLRHAISNGIFREPQPGIIAHNPLSRLMRDDEDTLGMVKFTFDEILPTAVRALDALDKWPGSRDPKQTAFVLRTGWTESPFAWLARDPEKVKNFAGMMRAITEMLTSGPDSLDRSPLWREIDKPGATFVDVGGGHGHVSLQVAKVTENVRFVVQELPEVVAIGEASLPAEYKDRVSFQASDFNREQTLKGAEVYFLRKILHSSPDHVSLEILRNLIPALKAGSKVVVCEYILPETAKPRYEEWDARNLDLNMMINSNGKERTTSEWKKLFADADSRFDLEFEQWECSTHGLIKATWKP
ncbi:S-adenosyl-L-methionine-dependent methyltransferase [Macrophomina phaseolina]|uniref:S-adenosyl-L-methionine-dependent methyltransferase n=1 Tax=Macrophomina phaseolina TaxID=35725 RepID=A0ABQ8FRK1_9PEZI|nr:S-adenosyl-L-methionine-dependent methyltransferase [Macrophomina phaseolina]